MAVIERFGGCCHGHDAAIKEAVQVQADRKKTKNRIKTATKLLPMHPVFRTHKQVLDETKL